jgi:cysteinyl-tRNA synthetase
VDGIDILGRFGLDLVVIPHWNNAEGGTHDTRFCFMGAPRFEKLVQLIGENIPVLGLDEHTACILDLAADEAEVKGIGTVVFRKNDREARFKSGERFSIDVLRGAAAQNWQLSQAIKPQQPDAGGRQDFWDRVHSLEERFHRGLAEHDAGESTNALLELDRGIWQAQTDLENEEFISQARDLLRELIVLLGNRLAASPGNETECLRPLVDALLELRQHFRAKRQYEAADALRGLLQRVGITVEDTEKGSRWQAAAKP